MQSEALHGVFYLKPAFYVALAFVIFFVLFGRTLARALTANLDGRIALVRRELDEAARLRAEAEAMLAGAESQRQDALRHGRELIASAHNEAARLAASMTSEAAAAADRAERTALERIAAAEAAVIADLRRSAMEIASGATEQVLATTFTAQDDAAVIDRAIAGLPLALKAA